MDTWVDEWSHCEITNTIRVMLLSQRLAGQWEPPGVEANSGLLVRGRLAVKFLPPGGTSSEDEL